MEQVESKTVIVSCSEILKYAVIGELSCLRTYQNLNQRREFYRELLLCRNLADYLIHQGHPTTVFSQMLLNAVLGYLEHF